MGFHTTVHTSSLTSAVGQSALAVVTDTVFSPSGSAYLLPSEYKLVAAYAGGANILRARINAPSMLRVGYPSIRPVQQASISGTATANPNLMTLLDDPVQLRTGEPVGVDAATASVGGENLVAALWFMDKLEPVPQGETFWLRFTSSTALSALAWKVITPSFDQAFPAGTYQAIGLEFTSPGAVIARVVFPGSVLRPGVIAQPGTLASGATVGAARTHRFFYDGTLGVFGTFQTSAPPSIEVFSITADAANTQEGYLRVIRIGDVGMPMPPPSASGGGVSMSTAPVSMTKR